MKTKLYIGQPADSPFSTSPGASYSTCFGTVEEVREFLAERKRLRSASSPAPTRPNAPEERANMDFCICSQTGSDGTTRCSKPLNKHHLRKSANTSFMTIWCCDNHLAVYLAIGWQEMARMACTRCCTNEPSLDGGELCEECIRVLDQQEVAGPKNDAVRLKEVGYCINRETVAGCAIYAEFGSNMCKFCQNYFHLTGASMAESDKSKYNPRVRPILTSARHCALTPGCGGTMTARVFRASFNSKPELWWRCAVCAVEKLAERTYAMPDLRVSAAQLEKIEEAALEAELTREPVNTDIVDMAQAIRGMNRGEV